MPQLPTPHAADKPAAAQHKKDRLAQALKENLKRRRKADKDKVRKA